MTSGFLKTKIKTSLRPCMERMFRQFIDSGVRLGCRAHHPAPPLCLHSAFHHTTSSRVQCGYHTIQPYCRRVYDVRAFVWGCGVCMGRMSLIKTSRFNFFSDFARPYFFPAYEHSCKNRRRNRSRTTFLSRSARFLRISPPFDIRSEQWSHLWNALENTLLTVCLTSQ